MADLGVTFTKADGTVIKNPVNFIKGIQKRGYNEPIFSDGEQVEDPVQFIESLSPGCLDDGTSKRSGTSDWQPAAKRIKSELVVQVSSNGALGMFKADGTAVRDPAAYVAGIRKNGYNEPLLDADGNDIEDPESYLQAMQQHGSAKANGGAATPQATSAAPVWRATASRTPSSTSTGMASAGMSGAVLFKSDGTAVRDPARYVEGIKKRGYNEPLMDAKGVQIRDPVAYVEKMVQREGPPPAARASVGSGFAVGFGGGAFTRPLALAVLRPAGGGAGARAGADGAVLFKSDGTAVRDPIAYVAGIEQRGYNEPLMDAKGQQIRDPVAYVKGMQQRQAGGAHQRAHSAPAAAWGAPASSAGAGKLFKADGTPIRDPAAFVAGIEKRGYNEPIYDGKGQQIKDPVAYVRKMT